MSEDTQEVRLPRITLDLKVPIWSVAVAFGSLVWALISMWFLLVSLGTQMAEVQALLKVSNALTSHLQGELALVKYRLEKIENAKP